jgi:hypothetical protein
MDSERNTPMRYLVRGVLLAGSMAGSMAGAAVPEYRLVIRDRRIEPVELAVPAGQPLKLVVQNEGAADAVVTSVGPLEPGRYEFYGEFNARTERGWLVVRA